MSPYTPFPHGRNKAHRDAVFLGKGATAAVGLGSVQDVANVFIRQLAVVARASLGNEVRARSSIVPVAASDGLRLQSGPMLIPTRHPFRVKRGSTADAASSCSVPLTVRGVFERRRPVEIGRRVVGRVAVPMGTMQRSLRRGTIKCLANEAVNLAGEVSAVDTQNVPAIASPPDARLEDLGGMTVLSRRHSLDAANAGDSVLREPRNQAPFFFGFHTENDSTIRLQSKLLDLAARPKREAGL